MTPRVPKTRNGVGTSFKGTAAYLLSDGRDEDGQVLGTDERVLWADTRNLATDDADQAWRVMAATAMDSDRIKREYHEAEQAKLPEEERTDYRASKPSKNHVFHYSLSWSGEQDGPTLTRDEMMRATYGSLRALGADHLQAMIVCHEAEKNPHVHVMVNRVNPETGRVERPESNAKYKLSEWALAYEKERGNVLCETRERNAALREAGLPYEQYRDEGHKANRDSQKVAAEKARDPDGADKLTKEQMALDRALGREGRDMRDRHSDQWDKLLSDHKFRKAMINQEADDAKTHAGRLIRGSYVGRFDAMREQHQQDEAEFIQREVGFFGKLKNVGSAVSHVWATRDENGANSFIGDTFEVIGNSGARLEALKRAQGMAHKTMNAQMQKEIDAAVHSLEGQRSAAIHSNYETFSTAKADLEFTQAGEKAANRAAWEQRDTERLKAWQDFGARTQLEQDFPDASMKAEARKTKASESQAFDQSATEDTAKTVGDMFGGGQEAQESVQPEPKQDHGRERKIDE